jgi:hypothetical protein
MIAGRPSRGVSMNITVLVPFGDRSGTVQQGGPSGSMLTDS